MTWRQHAAAAYPFLFAVIFRRNLRWVDRKRAADIGVDFLTHLSFIPLLLALLALLRAAGRPSRIEGMSYAALLIVSMALWFGLDWLHGRWLVRKRLGMRFVERYDRIDAMDRLWIKLLTTLFLVVYAGLFVALVMLVAP